MQLGWGLDSGLLGLVVQQKDLGSRLKLSPVCIADDRLSAGHDVRFLA